MIILLFLTFFLYLQATKNPNTCTRNLDMYIDFIKCPQNIIYVLKKILSI